MLTITRLSDGVTDEAPVGALNSQGIALLSNGSIALILDCDALATAATEGLASVPAAA